MKKALIFQIGLPILAIAFQLPWWAILISFIPMAATIFAILMLWVYEKTQ